VYAVITFGHLKIRQQTGAKQWPLWSAIVINLSLFTTLFINVIQTAPGSAIALACALVGSFCLEALSRKYLKKPT
jgi:hypothetical protein